MWLSIILAWLFILLFSWRLERRTSTRRHIRLAVEVFKEELRRIQLRKLSGSAPGGIECQLPPEGWRCTREAGHDGPCAAIQLYVSDNENSFYKTI